MEAWQLNHIKNNLPQLLANTDCNVSLISILESKDVLSKQESELIQSKQTKYEKAKCLFKIIETRNNSYKILLSALDETKQSGAHLILNANFIKFNQFGNLEYQKEKRLGRISGCGEFVYYKGKFSNRKTAIRKECYTGDTEYATSRIKREIDLLTKLDCQENILRYFTCKFDDDLRHLLIVFERCSTTLEIYVRQRKDELDKAKKTSILQQLTSALCFLQFKNIIYLNLRPSSILISEDLPNNPRPKFSNFSSAFRSADGKGNVLANTLEKNKDWLPGNIQSSIPKRLKEVNVDPTADIYSLGCVFHFVWFAKHPFGKLHFRNVHMIKNKPYRYPQDQLICRDLIQKMIQCGKNADASLDHVIPYLNKHAQG